jgi:hypothetical protein
MTYRRLLLLALLGQAACASRSVPAYHPAKAASSAQAPEAGLADVTHSLTGEPPMPGEPSAGWPGLAEPSTLEPAPVGGTASDAASPSSGSPADPHAGHGSHGGHSHHGAH